MSNTPITTDVHDTQYVAKRDGSFTNSPYCHKTKLRLFITG